MPADSPFFPVILLALMQNPLHRYPSYPESILLPATYIFRPPTHYQNPFYIPQAPRTAFVCLSYEPPILSRLIAKLQYFLFLQIHLFATDNLYHFLIYASFNNVSSDRTSFIKISVNPSYSL